MKKSSIILGLLLGIYTIGNAQECVVFFPKTDGAVLTYQSLDKKDKPIGTYSQKISNIKQGNNSLSATVESEYFDKKGNSTIKSNFDVSCKDGVYSVDMENFVNSQMLAPYKDMDITIEGNSLNFPSDMKTGDILNDGTITITIENSGFKVMTMTTSITDRKIEAQEKITTDAGTFECFRISYKLQTKAIMSVNMTVKEWYSPEVGLIKSETYSSKGSYGGKTELISLQR